MRLTARVITEVLAPWVIVIGLPMIVAWQTTGSGAATITWGGLIALTSSIIPMGVIVWGARRGRWDGHHVRNRAGRLIPFAALIASSVLGLGLLLGGGAPWALVALDISMIVMLLVTGAITVKWKISMHASVASGAAAVLGTLYASVGVLVGVLALAVAISWSRVQLGDHTRREVLGGLAVGVLVGGVVFTGLSPFAPV